MRVPGTVSAGPASFDQRRFLGLVACAGVGFGMTAPLTVLYAESFGAGDTLAGFTVASIALTLLAVDVTGTRLVPRVDGRFAITFSLVVFGLGSVAMGCSVTLWQVIATRMFQGIGAAFFMGGALQVVVRFAPPEHAGRTIGLFNAAWFGGIAVGPSLGGFIAAHGDGRAGMRLAFWVCGACCFAVAAGGRAGLDPIPSPARPRLSMPRSPRATPGLRMWPPLLLAALGQFVRGGLMYTVIPLLGTRRLALGPGSVGLALSLMALVDLLAMRFGGSLADRVGRGRVLVLALASGGAVAALAPLVEGVAGFCVWCAALGVVVGVMWVVPVAIVVDVAEIPEVGLSVYRIGADVGQLTGSTGAGALIAAAGPIGAAVAFGVAFLGLAGWVLRLPEAASRSPAAAALPPERVAPG